MSATNPIDSCAFDEIRVPLIPFYEFPFVVPVR